MRAAPLPHARSHAIPRPGIVLALLLAVLPAMAHPARAQPALTWTFRGALAPDDAADFMGRHADTIDIPAIITQGQWIIAKVTTTGFDPMVQINAAGQAVAADDAQGSRVVSIAQAIVPADTAGFQVVVSAWKAGATGAYTLEVEVRDDYTWFGIPPIATVVPGTPIAGYLDNTDPVVNNRHCEVYTLDTQPGVFYDILVEAALRPDGQPRFDPVLHALVAGGEELFSDDAVEAMADGTIATRVDRSHIRFFSPAAERLTLVTRAYGNAEGGPYTLRVATSTSRIFAVSAGFDSYAKSSPLSECSNDARRVIDALRPMGLTDEHAVLLHQPTGGLEVADLAGNQVPSTRDAILDALHRFGQQMGPSDLLVFFYSGHGGRARSAAIDASDPDGLYEYLALAEGSRLTDDELAAALPTTGRTLVIIDACFSGGFARDTIDRPGRAGIFACTEDATSLVWRGRGGGYLAPLLEEALGERGRYAPAAGQYPADVDQDGVLTLAELSLYLQRRYREVLDQGSSARPPATPSLDRERHIDTVQFPGWQHLVVDRAGLGPFEPILMWR